MSSPAAAVSHTTFHTQHHNYTHPSHQQQHNLSSNTTARGPLPVIPDLRFESSYVRSVRRYIEVVRVGEGSQGGAEAREAQLLQYTLGKDNEHEKVEDLEQDSSATVSPSSSGPREIIRVQWKSVIWVTLRDQVLSPLVQGTLWALASYYITPFSAQLGSRMGTFVHQSIPAKEGQGVAWLRGWGKSLGLSGTGGTVPPSRTSNSSSYRY